MLLFKFLNFSAALTKILASDFFSFVLIVVRAFFSCSSSEFEAFVILYFQFLIAAEFLIVLFTIFELIQMLLTLISIFKEALLKAFFRFLALFTFKFLFLELLFLFPPLFAFKAFFPLLTFFISKEFLHFIYFLSILQLLHFFYPTMLCFNDLLII